MEFVLPVVVLLEEPPGHVVLGLSLFPVALGEAQLVVVDEHHGVFLHVIT